MALGRQFRLLRETYNSPIEGSASQRDYRVVDQDDDVHAAMSVQDYSNEPLRRTNWNERRPYMGGDINADRPWNPHTGEGQQVLFEETYQHSLARPGSSKLVNAAMTKGARSMALPLLAQAAYDTAEAGRGALLPSDDLSPQSAPLVARLKERGLVDKDAITSVGNTIGFAEEPWSRPFRDEQRDYSDYDEEELDLKAASRKGRSILKHTRVPKPETVEQMRLSGL